MEPEIKFEQHNTKRIWIIYAAALVLVVAAGSYFILRSIPRVKQEPAKPQTTQQEADSSKQAGVKAEANGDSTKALQEYQAAYDAYKRAGNKSAAEDMSYKIEFMKQAIKADKEATAEAIKNGDAPSKDN